MTVSAQIPVNSSDGNGITTVFPYNFKILRAQDIQVLVDGVALSLGVHYSVTGVGNNSGGDVTILTAPAGGATVVRRRNMEFVRDTDFQYQGNLPAAVLNPDLDRPILMLQQLFEMVARGMLGAPGEQWPALPGAQSRLDRMIVFDAATGLPEISNFTATQVWGAITAAYSAGGSTADAIVYQRPSPGSILQTLYAKLLRMEVDIEEFGYVFGQDALAAVNNAISSLPVFGGKVNLPDRVGVSGQIVIGNGNGGTTFSSRNGVKLVGRGGGFGVSGADVPTIIEYTGPATTSPVIAVRGRICDVSLENFLLDCKGNAAGISMRAFTGCHVSQVKVINPASNTAALSVLGGTTVAGNYNIFNRFEQISVALLQPNAIGVYLDGDYPSINDTWLTSFDLLRVDFGAGATNAVGVWCRFVDSITFRRCHSDGRAATGTIDLYLDAVGNPGSLNNYPIGIASYDCSWHVITVNEDVTSKIGPCYFHGLGVNDGEVPPNHPRLWGTTANGEAFGYAPGFKNRALVDVVVQNTTATTPVYAYSVGAYFLGGGDSFRTPNGGLRVKHFGNYVNDSGANRDFTVAVVLGGVALLTFSLTGIPASASPRPVLLDLEFNLGSGMTNRQICRGTLTLGAAGAANGVGAAPYASQSGSNSTPGTAVNTAVSRDLEIVVAHGAASSSIAYTAKSTILELA